MMPMHTQPTTGTSTLHTPRWCAAGDTAARDSRWKKKTFVKNVISASNAFATYAERTPSATASAAMAMVRRSVVKSPRVSWEAGPAPSSDARITAAASFSSVVVAVALGPPVARRLEEHRRAAVAQGHGVDQPPELARQPLAAAGA